MPSSRVGENYRTRIAQGIAFKTVSSAAVGTPRLYCDTVENLASGQQLPIAHGRWQRKPQSCSALPLRRRRRRRANQERRVVVMLTALLALIVLIAVAWAVHDGQAVLERREYEKHWND